MRGSIARRKREETQKSLRRALAAVLLGALLLATVTSSVHWTIPVPGVGWAVPVTEFAYELAVAVAIACVLGLFVEKYVVGEISKSVIEEIEPELVGRDPLILQEYRYLRSINWTRLEYAITLRLERIGKDPEDPRPFRARATTQYKVVNKSGEPLPYRHKVSLLGCRDAEDPKIERVWAVGSDLTVDGKRGGYEGKIRPEDPLNHEKIVEIAESDEPKNLFKHTYTVRVEADDVWSWIMEHPTLCVSLDVDIPSELDCSVDFLHRCKDERTIQKPRWELSRFFVPGTGVSIRWHPTEDGDQSTAGVPQDSAASLDTSDT